MVDIVTHAGIGLVLAAPLLAEHPALALALVAGSVAPDLDAFSRVLGKRAFLAAHQTWSHALPVITLLAALAGGVVAVCGGPGLQVGLGLAAGMALHSLLDLTNTYGITLWLPWRRQRACLEWLFFIDAGTIALTAAAGAWIGWLVAHGEPPGWAPTSAWAIGLMLWIAWRARLRARAARMAPPGTVALIPSAWHPWRFHGTRQDAATVSAFTLDLRQRTVAGGASHAIHDGALAALLAQVPEFTAMRALSPAYHAIAVTRDGGRTVITCRDLRIRNFTGSFGACDIAAEDGRVVRVAFHV